MSIEDIVRTTSTPISATLKRFDWWDRLYLSRSLPFTMEAQTQTNWCWAATSKSVSHFYWFLSPWTQCTIANAELGRNDACQNPVPAAANVPWYLDRALSRTSNFVSITAGTATFAQIRAEIDAGRPMGARIGWNGGGGHFVVIYGYASWGLTQWVYIDDPIWGKSQLTLADFSTNYRGSGTWTHYYITKSYRRWWWPDVIIPEPLFKKLWEARQLLVLRDAADPERAAAPAPEPSYGLAHRVYTATLDQIAAGRAAEAESTGLRVYESVDGRLTAFYDVDDSDEGAVRSMSNAPARLEAFSEAVAAADSAGLDREDTHDGGARDSGATEASILSIPALNFEALWVRGRRGDSVIPTVANGGLEPGRAYPYEEAMRALRAAAEPLIGMDDTMGA